MRRYEVMAQVGRASRMRCAVYDRQLTMLPTRLGNVCFILTVIVSSYTSSDCH